MYLKNYKTYQKIGRCEPEPGENSDKKWTKNGRDDEISCYKYVK
jgi:hypothetical protein